jgi:hypothetical protein
MAGLRGDDGADMGHSMLCPYEDNPRAQAGVPVPQKRKSRVFSRRLTVSEKRRKQSGFFPGVVLALNGEGVAGDLRNVGDFLLRLASQFFDFGVGGGVPLKL